MKKTEKFYKEKIDALIDGKVDLPLCDDDKKDAVTEKLEELRKKMLSDRIAEEKRNEEINTKIAEVAHDLKTPIATVAGYAECIQDGIDDKDYPELIIKKTQEMGEQVLGIIDGVRPDKNEGKKTFVEAKVFFTKAIKKAAEEIKGKEITVKFKGMHRGYVYIDVKKISRVIQNLVTNAAKYSKDKCKITVRGSLWGDKYYLRIKDNGIGIKKEDRKHVFEQFYMADKSRNSGGSGLGLHICKEFVEEHGGEIKVKSNGKHGSTFAFSLPIVRNAEKVSFTEKFERQGQFFKMIIFLFFGWVVSAVYRFSRYSETKCPSTLIAGIFGFLLIFPIWFLDFVSETVYNKLTFLAD